MGNHMFIAHGIFIESDVTIWVLAAIYLIVSMVESMEGLVLVHD
jgi:hypothetical protein